MISKILYTMLNRENTMKSNLELPMLEKLGISREVVVFVEIARHPDGLTISDLTKKVLLERETIRYQTREMTKNNFITTSQEIRNGRTFSVFHATPYGIDRIGKELKSLCAMIIEIEKEMLAKCPPKK